MKQRADIVFLSHGGGPLPLLGDADHRALVRQWQRLVVNLKRPDAIIVVSAHFEAPVVTMTAAEQPTLLYDYQGFAPEAYDISYPSFGAPALAKRLHGALLAQGIESRLDVNRGLDHGVFVPLKIMYPDADIPVLSLSILSSLDAQQHLNYGKALRLLADENLLIVGSGFSFHNMRAFYANTPGDDEKAQQFSTWLNATLSDRSLSEPERYRRLASWDKAPHARWCHPREEHLLPLHVCYGIAGRACDVAESVPVLGKQAGLYLWQGQKVG